MYKLFILNVIIRKQLFWCNVVCIYILKFINTEFTISVVELLKGLSSASMMRPENLKFNPYSVNKYSHNIISYLPLAESSLWHFRVMSFIALSLDKVKIHFNLKISINITSLHGPFHHIIYLWQSFLTSLPNTIVEQHTISNRILKFLNLSLPLRVFINPYIIG